MRSQIMVKLLNMGALRILVLALIAPLASAQGGEKRLPESAALRACFLAAERFMLAGEQARSRAPREAATEAVRAQLATAGDRDDEALHAALDAVYRDRPQALNAYVHERLETCLAEAGGGTPLAGPCYDQTLWANTIFLSRERGVPLERMLEGYRRASGGPGPPERMIEAVYRSSQSRLGFRIDWFLACAGARG
jgi:hypothetical protein